MRAVLKAARLCLDSASPYVLDSPIRIQSSTRVEKQQSWKYDQHDYSGLLENENANVPLSTAYNHNDKNTRFTRFSVPTWCFPSRRHMGFKTKAFSSKARIV